MEPQSSIEILGLHVQADGHKAVNRTLTQGEHMMRRRVADKSRGLKEADLLKLRDALITSRIRYQIPYVNLTKTPEKSEKPQRQH